MEARMKFRGKSHYYWSGGWIERSLPYLQKAYRRIYFEKCLRPGAYEFTVYDTGGDGMYGKYELKLAGEVIKTGAMRCFLSSETTSINVSNRWLIACFSGSSTVTVMGKGTIEMWLKLVI
jgi:hypothetical protein